MLWASDIPYGDPIAALNLFVRSARLSGGRATTCCAGCCATTRSGCSRGGGPATRSAPLASPEFRTSYARIRANNYLAGRDAAAVARAAGAIGFLGLAAAALDDEGLDGQAELVRCARALWDVWAANLVPSAPPDIAGRGRVWRLLNQAQADTLLA